jgi:hypothetical protein
VLTVGCAMDNMSEPVSLPATADVYADFEWDDLRRLDAVRAQYRALHKGCCGRSWVWELVACVVTALLLAWLV